VSGYDPFGAGPLAVATRTFSAPDPARGRVFPGEIWTPAPGRTGTGGLPLPLVIFCHGSGGNRKSAAYLCAHLASHGYAVAAIDHSEVVTAEPAPAADETAGQRAARIDAVIASRVPDGGGGVRAPGVLTRQASSHQAMAGRAR
jgi:predicted dienelactone hydrolase